MRDLPAVGRCEFGVSYTIERVCYFPLFFLLPVAFLMYNRSMYLCMCSCWHMGMCRCMYVYDICQIHTCVCITWSLIVFCVVAYVQGHWYASVYVYVLCHSYVSISMCGRYIGIWMSVYIYFILIVLFIGFTVFIILTLASR